MTHGNATNKRILSPLQFGLFLVVFLLAISIEVLIVRAYFSSGDTAAGVEEARYDVTNLANIQRETLMLQTETDRVISGSNPPGQWTTFKD